MERYDELMQRVCAYVESKLKKTALRDEVCYSEYDINIRIDSDLVDDFTYTTKPEYLEDCLNHNGCITPIALDVLKKLHQHINETYFIYN